MTQNVRNTEKTSDNTAKSSTEEGAKKPHEGAAPKGGAFTVTLGFSSLMTALTALVGCVVVAFMMGVIVGRDDVSSRPTLAEIAEEQDAAVAAALAAAKNAVSQNTAPATEGQDAAQPKSGEASVMSPEELKYATALKGKNAAASKSTAEATPPVTPSATPLATQATTPPATSTNAAPTTSTASSATAQNATQETAQDPAQALFDYEYQVASLKDENAVDKLRAKLEGEGLRTRMSKIGGYLKVSVHMRGTTAQAQALEQRMVELKLGKPVLQGKKAVQ